MSTRQLSELSDENVRYVTKENAIVQRWGKPTIEPGELFDHPLIKAGGIDGAHMKAYSLALDILHTKDQSHACIPINCSNLEHRHILQLALLRQSEQYDRVAPQLPREDQVVLCQMEARLWKIHDIQAQKTQRTATAWEAAEEAVGAAPGVGSSISHLLKAGRKLFEVFQDPSETFSPDFHPFTGLSGEEVREICRGAGVNDLDVDVAISHAYQDRMLGELRTALAPLEPKIQSVAEALQRDIQGRQDQFEQARSEEKRMEVFRNRKEKLEGMINNVQYSCVIASSIANVVFKNPRLASKIDIIGNAVTEGLHLACSGTTLTAFPVALGSPVLAFASIGLGAISRLYAQKQAEQQNRVMQQVFSQIMQGMQALQKTMNIHFRALEQLGQQQLSMLGKIDEHLAQVSKQIAHLGQRTDFQLRCMSAQLHQQAALAQNFEEIEFGRLHDENRALMTRLGTVEGLVRKVQQGQIYQSYCQAETLRRQQRNSWYQQTAQTWNDLERLFLNMGNRIHDIYRALQEHLSRDPGILWELWGQMMNVLTGEAYREPVNGSRYLRGDITTALGDQIYARQLRGKISNAQFCARFLFPSVNVMNRSVWEHMAQLLISFFSALEQSRDIRDKFTENPEIRDAICKIRMQVEEEQQFTIAVANSIPQLKDRYLDSVRAVVESSRQICQAEVARLTDERARDVMDQARQKEVEQLQLQQRGLLRQPFTLPSRMEATMRKFQHSHVSDKEIEAYDACQERWKEKHSRKKSRAPIHAEKHHPEAAQHIQLQKGVDKIEKKRPQLERRFQARIESRVQDRDRRISELRSGRSEPFSVPRTKAFQPTASMLLEAAHTVTSPLYQKLLELDDNYCILSAAIVYAFQTIIQELPISAPERAKAFFEFLEISDNGFVKTRGEFVSHLMAVKDAFELDVSLTAIDPSLMEQAVEQLMEAARSGELTVGWKRGNDLLRSFDLVLQSPVHAAT